MKNIAFILLGILLIALGIYAYPVQGWVVLAIYGCIAILLGLVAIRNNGIRE